VVFFAILVSRFSAWTVAGQRPVEHLRGHWQRNAERDGGDPPGKESPDRSVSSILDHNQLAMGIAAHMIAANGVVANHCRITAPAIRQLYYYRERLIDDIKLRRTGHWARRNSDGRQLDGVG
jgi:hypothetical protein